MRSPARTATWHEDSRAACLLAMGPKSDGECVPRAVQPKDNKWSVADESIATGVPASRVLAAVRRRVERLHHGRPRAEKNPGPFQCRSRGAVRKLPQLRIRGRTGHELRR